MSVLTECPFCHKKQSLENNRCTCGADLVRLKRQKEKVRYWISFRVPGPKGKDGKTTHKQRREYVGYSIEEARDADGKRRGQKRENRIFDMLPDTFTTYNELAEWFLALESVKELKSYDRLCGLVANFNKVFGDRLINNVMNVDLENYQLKRKNQGLKPRTVDYEIQTAQRMVTKVFENRKISGDAVLTFKSIKKMLKKNANTRARTISIDEYVNLVKGAADHLKPFIIIAYNTGMRKGEIRKLRWKDVDWKEMFIRLPARITKENKPKDIPINCNVEAVLKAVKPQRPRAVDSDYHDFVFTYNKEPITHKDGLNRSFKTACKNAGIAYGMNAPDGIIFHDIRRTVKTNMLTADVKKEYRDMIFGHRPQDMDARYIVPSKDELTKAMNQYTAWLNSQVDEKGESKNLVNIWSTFA